MKERDYSKLIPNAAEISEEDEAALEAMGSTRQTDRIVQRLLMITLIISAVLFTAGAIWQALAGLSPVHDVVPLADLPHAHGPSLLFSLGLIVLITSPVVRLIGVAIGLARQGDWAFVGVTVIVLTVMFASLWVG